MSCHHVCRAGGRLIHASEGADRNLSFMLEEGRGPQAVWRYTSPMTTSTLMNSYYSDICLGAKVHPVVVLEEDDVSTWENSLFSIIESAMAEIEECKQREDRLQRQIKDLIHAGRKATATSDAEIKKLLDRLEEANNTALHWQEEALLLRNSVQRKERVQKQRNDRYSRREVEDLHELHGKRVKELEERYLREFDTLRKGLEAEHDAHIAELMNERIRVQSALSSIKDITNGRWIDEISDDDDFQRHEYGFEEPAVSNDANEVSNSAASLSLGFRSGCEASGDGASRLTSTTDSISSVSLPGRQILYSTSYDQIIDKLRSSAETVSEISSFPGKLFVTSLDSDNQEASHSTCVIRSQQQRQQKMEGEKALLPTLDESAEKTFDQELHANCQSPCRRFGCEAPIVQEEKKEKTLNCTVVEFKGDPPGLINEAAMSRILDPPIHPKYEATATKDSNTIQHGDDTLAITRTQELLSSQTDGKSVTSCNSRDCEDALNASASEGSNRRVERRPPSASAPASAAKSEQLEKSLGWALGSLSLPASQNQTPFPSKTQASDPEFNHCEELSSLSMRLCAALEALDSGSPRDANLLVQHMSDQVAVRATMSQPRQNDNDNRRKKRNATKESYSIEDFSGSSPCCIPARRRCSASRSTPTSTSRASFLLRKPVDTTDLFIH